MHYNQTDPFHVGDSWGGIPLNLLTNVLGSIIIILLFIVIRRNTVKKVGRKIASDTKENVENITMILFGRRRDINKNSDICETEDKSSKRRRYETFETDDETLSISSKFGTFKDNIGEDAVQYLLFQKFILIYMIFTTVISLGRRLINSIAFNISKKYFLPGIVLPLNFQGTQLGNGTEFGHTTLANLNPNQESDNIILWIHLLISFTMFPVAIILMRKFSQSLKMTDTNLKTTRTVAIGHVEICF